MKWGEGVLEEHVGIGRKKFEVYMIIYHCIFVYKFLKNHTIYMCVCVCIRACMCVRACTFMHHSTDVKVKGQLLRASFLLLPSMLCE